MSECVVRMEMPTLEKGCKLAIGNEYMFCQIEARLCNFYELGGKCPSWCPIICQLPEGHGRLVDAEKLKAKKYHSDITHENAVAVAEIDWAETIVPADTAERSE